MALDISSPLPTVGGDLGTWGTELNTAITEIINEAGKDSDIVSLQSTKADKTNPVLDGTATGTTGSLNDLLRIGQTASLAIALKQGSTRYRANVFVDSINPLSSVFWMGNSQPAQAGAQAQSIDVYNITVIKIAPSSYTIMVSNTTFSHANGQGMGPGGAQ